MKTGEKIKQERTKKLMMQSTLAKACELSQWTISMWETCKRKPNRRQVEQIARVLEVEPQALIGEDGTAAMPKEDESEKVARLNEAIVKKNEQIKELEDTVLEQMEQIENLKKQQRRDNTEELKAEIMQLKAFIADMVLREKGVIKCP